MDILYELLKKRHPNENISHRALPSLEEHKRFFYSKPYLQWRLIEIEKNKFAGAIYLTRASEIGIHLFPEHQGKGYGPKAIQMMMLVGGRQRYLANISVKNKKSAKTFEKLGFEHIQNTYEFINDKP